MLKKIISAAFAFVAGVYVGVAEPSGSLPVLYINTDGGTPITSKEDYITATYYLDPNGRDVEAFGSEAEPLPLQIRGRGNYTWTGFDKKPYRLKLDKKAALMGCAKSKHFALLAHADDCYGFLRNAVGFELSRMLGLDWTPADKPLEVVLNGDYIGLYFLTETIRVDSDRVNVVDQEEEGVEPDVTGGWLAEIDNYDSDPHITLREGCDEEYDIWFTYSSPEILSAEQEKFLTDEMARVDRLVYDVDKSNCQWADYVDLDHLARFYVVQELVDNYESFHGSCYLYRERGEGQKWKFGPVWDFGNAFTYHKGNFIYEGREWHQVWIGEMCKFPAFIEVVKDVYKEFVDAGGLNAILAYATKYGEAIAEAARNDYRRWPQYGNEDVVDKASTVRSRLRQAVSWLNEQWGIESGNDGYVTVKFYDETENPWRQVYAFTWDKDNDNKAHLGGWPGTIMTATDYTVGGATLWTITFTPDEPYSGNLGIVFNNGSDGEDNQTDDFVLENGATYNRQGVSFDDVDDDDSSVSDIRSSGLEISVRDGQLVVVSSEARSISVVRIDGSVKNINVSVGINTLTLPHGFYIVDGNKVAL